MSGVLTLLITQPSLNDEEIGQRFGYKSPFTKRYKSWLKKCGILENSSKAKLTKEGKEIFYEDLQLTKENTLRYMHSFLTNSEKNAEVWNFFYHKFLPQNESFTRTELSAAISKKLMPHNMNHFAKNAPMIKVILKVLLDSYISEKAFARLQIIGFDGEKIYRI
jgi:hypothetical protein